MLEICQICADVKEFVWSGLTTSVPTRKSSMNVRPQCRKVWTAACVVSKGPFISVSSLSLSLNGEVINLATFNDCSDCQIWIFFSNRVVSTLLYVVVKFFFAADRQLLL